MELKKYQRRVIEEVDEFLKELAKEQASGNKHATLDAWDNLRVPVGGIRWPAALTSGHTVG